MNLMLTMFMKRLSEKKKTEYASGRDEELAEGREYLDKIMKYTGLSKKELTMLL